MTSYPWLGGAKGFSSQQTSRRPAQLPQPVTSKEKSSKSNGQSSRQGPTVVAPQMPSKGKGGHTCTFVFLLVLSICCLSESTIRCRVHPSSQREQQYPPATTTDLPWTALILSSCLISSHLISSGDDNDNAVPAASRALYFVFIRVLL